MQWYHYLNAAVVGGLVAYWYLSNRDQLSEDERKEFDAAMALEEHELAAGPEEHEEPEELEEPEEGADPEAVRDPAAALAQRQAENEPVQLNSWKNREVRAKKARSLALKAQRRNYSEYLEEQARARRERDELEQEMFGDIIAEERAQRELRSEQARIKLEEQQRTRREAEERERRAYTERQATLKKDIETQGYAKIKQGDDKTLISELGTVVGNGEYVVGGPKVLEEMKKALASGEATWSQLVQV